MNHPNYVKKRDEIIRGFIDDVTGAHEEAAQAIDALVLEREKAAEQRGFNKGYSECMKEWQTL